MENIRKKVKNCGTQSETYDELFQSFLVQIQELKREVSEVQSQAQTAMAEQLSMSNRFEGMQQQLQKAQVSLLCKESELRQCGDNAQQAELIRKQLQHQADTMKMAHQNVLGQFDELK